MEGQETTAAGPTRDRIEAPDAAGGNLTETKLYWGVSGEGRSARLKAEKRLAAEKRRKREQRFFVSCVVQVVLYALAGVAAAGGSIAFALKETYQRGRGIAVLAFAALGLFILSGNAFLWAWIIRRYPQEWTGRGLVHGDYFSGYLTWMRLRGSGYTKASRTDSAGES